MIAVENLSFRYEKDAPPAVDGIDFTVERGECFGFLGPNGAGKSTTIKLLTGQLPLQGGTVRILDHDLRNPEPAYFEQIGVSFELPNIYEKFTVLENLEFYRRLYSGETRDPKELLELVGLGDAADKRGSECSRGMLQRLVFARALIPDPRALFLDEPTGGLDPDIALVIREAIHRALDNGVTVFLTTHNMYEADSLCDRVAFIHNGGLAAVDTPHDLKLALGERRIAVEVIEDGRSTTRELSLDDAEDRERLGRWLVEGAVVTMHTKEATLEDAFVKLVGQHL
jgi:fluoroquinolone transport system ATP-binding protein